MNDLVRDRIQLIKDAHGATGDLIARVHEALPPVMAHHLLSYDYWTQMAFIERLRKVLEVASQKC